MFMNTLIGLISGVVSGYIVSLYFQKNQEKRDWILAFREDKQNLHNFLYALSIELDILMDEAKNNEKIDIKDAKRVFSRQPRTLTFSEETITEESLKKVMQVRVLVNGIENKLSAETTLNTLRNYRKELFNARTDVLSIKSIKK